MMTQHASIMDAIAGEQAALSIREARWIAELVLAEITPGVESRKGRACRMKKAFFRPGLSFLDCEVIMDGIKVEWPFPRKLEVSWQFSNGTLLISLAIGR